jgi:hypothetical protein
MVIVAPNVGVHVRTIVPVRRRNVLYMLPGGFLLHGTGGRHGSTRYKLLEWTAVLAPTDDDEAVAGMQCL